MPYVPDQDRPVIDKSLEPVADFISYNTPNNFDILSEYVKTFTIIGQSLISLSNGKTVGESLTEKLAITIFDVAKKYEYQGAFLGELNYAMTRLIQRVPQIKVKLGHWVEKSELRYWLYATTTESLTVTADNFKNSGIGIGGVFEDIKDEYKRRVNVGYEAAQIIKSGDCYDTPYYTRLVEVRDDNGNLIGHQEIMLKRSDATLKKDVLDGSFVLSTKQLVTNGISK